MQKILIIDDEPDICLLLKRFLSKKGFEAEYATEAEKGLDMLDSFRPDLVLCDFRLGKMDGGEVLTRIKEKHPRLPVLIMTGYSDIKIAVTVMKKGAFDYLTKPLFPDEIYLTIQRALEQAAQLPEEAAQPAAPAAPALEAAPEQAQSAPPKAVAKPRKSAGLKGDYIFGSSPISQHLVKQVDLVAPTNYSVIIYGESGSGKEAVAREIHNRSKRADKPFVAMDCGAISPQLAGSELFGHEKGSFTGALEQKIGHFEMANGGTLFLDEVANLSYDVQVSLLRVVQERRLRRIGGNKEVDIDVRIIVASNEKLWEASRSGKFREDLYHRFNEFSIDVPPLRDRDNDIMLFAQFFLDRTNAELGKDVEGFSADTEALFRGYPWYGNLREMKNVMKRATLLCDSARIEAKHLPFELVNFERVLFAEREAMPIAPMAAPTPMYTQPTHAQPTYAAPPSYPPPPPPAAATGPVSLKSAAMEAESEMILNALRKTNFNKSKAAELLGIDRKTLYNKMKQFNL